MEAKAAWLTLLSLSASLSCLGKRGTFQPACRDRHWKMRRTTIAQISRPSRAWAISTFSSWYSTWDSVFLWENFHPAYRDLASTLVTSQEAGQPTGSYELTASFVLELGMTWDLGKELQLTQSLSRISRENSYASTLPNTHQLFLLVLRKEPRQPSVDSCEWHLKKLNRSKVLDIADIQERFIWKGHFPPPCCPHTIRATGAPHASGALVCRHLHVTFAVRQTSIKSICKFLYKSNYHLCQCGVWLPLGCFFRVEDNFGVSF